MIRLELLEYSGVRDVSKSVQNSLIGFYIICANYGSGLWILNTSPVERIRESFSFFFGLKILDCDLRIDLGISLLTKV